MAKSKARYTGTHQYIDKDTGQVVTANQIVQKVSYRHFWKANIRSLVVQLGMVTSKSLDVLEYLLDNISPRSNKLTETNKSIAGHLHVGYATVARTLSFLNHQDIIRRRTGVVMFNPKLLLHGSEHKRDYLMIVFKKMPKQKPNKFKGKHIKTNHKPKKSYTSNTVFTDIPKGAYSKFKQNKKPVRD